MPVSQFALTNASAVNEHLGQATYAAATQTYIDNLINRTSDEIERTTHRRFVARDYREYYDGNGTDTLKLRNYPVLSVATLNDDVQLDYDSADTIDKDDIQIRENRGEIRLINNESTFAQGRENVLIEYHAGYAFLEVSWGSQYIHFTERSGGTQYNALIPPGIHQITSLASHIANEMTKTGLNTYHVSYNTKTRIPTITLATGASGTLTIQGAAGGTSSLLPILGFSGATLSGATAYTPATAVSPFIPREIAQTCINIVSERFETSPYGTRKGSRGLKSQRIGNFSQTFFGTPISKDDHETLKRWTKRFIM